jgi:hypothetical protein
MNFVRFTTFCWFGRHSKYIYDQWRTEGGWGVQPPSLNSAVLTKLSRIPSGKYIRNNLIRIRVSLVCRLSGTPEWWLPPPDPRSLCPLSSTEFVDPPPEKLQGPPLVAPGLDAFCVLFFVRYGGNQIKEDETGRACRMHRYIRNGYKIWSRNVIGRDHLGNLGVSGR